MTSSTRPVSVADVTVCCASAVNDELLKTTATTRQRARKVNCPDNLFRTGFLLISKMVDAVTPIALSAFVFGERFFLAEGAKGKLKSAKRKGRQEIKLAPYNNGREHAPDNFEPGAHSKQRESRAILDD